MATVVIAAASRGIGLSLVGVYEGRGDRIFALCREPASATELADMAHRSGGAITMLKADVIDEASVKSAVAAIGDQPIDLLINVAGIFRHETRPEDNDFDHWRESFEAMAIAPFRLAVELLPRIEKARGRIISLTSQIGASTWPYGGMYSYGAAKAALNRAMQSLALDVKSRGVSVGLVHPGYVQTDMGGPNAEITPLESAEGIAAVADKLSLETTGGFWKWNGEPHSF